MKRDSVIPERLMVLCLLVLIAFYPTSVLGKIKGADSAIVCWLLVGLTVVFFALRHRYRVTNLVTADIFFIAYMFLVTLLAQGVFGGGRVSLARIAPVLVFVLACNVRIKRVPPFDFMERCLNCFTIVIVIWNVLTLAGNAALRQFTWDNYTQYYESAIYNAIYLNNKPVMTFGVHTYASFYYFLLFYFHSKAFDYNNHWYHMVFMVVMIVFTILLFSTTSLIYSIAMAIFFFMKYYRKNKLTFAGIILLIVISMVIIGYYFPIIQKRFWTNLTSANNGFNSRYLNTTVFQNNIRVISESLGIGFNIMDSMDIGYSDSGYIIYMTMGHIPMTVFMYYSLWVFLKKNVPAQFLTFISLFMYSFEVALPATFNYRYVPTMFFTVMYLQALAFAKPKNKIRMH